MNVPQRWNRRNSFALMETKNHLDKSCMATLMQSSKIKVAWSVPNFSKWFFIRKIKTPFVTHCSFYVLMFVIIIACRYEKSSWSECNSNGEMSRTDMLKANSDPSCDQSRRITKKCNKNKQVKASKDKGECQKCILAGSHFSFSKKNT